MAALLATLEWRRAPWLWPPLFALWANLHGGYLFGLGVLGLHAIDATESAFSDPAARSRARRIWLGVLAASAAAALNPWGVAIYALPFSTLAHVASHEPLRRRARIATHANVAPISAR